MQAFRQEGEYGHYLRVNPDYRRWEIAENLRPSITPESTLFVSLSCYTICPANLMEITTMAGFQLSWTSRKWPGLELLMKCSEHSKEGWKQLFQTMSLYSEDIRKIDAQAEKILQRAENRVLVVNNYTYEYVAGLRNKSASNVQGNISVIIINEHILGFYQSVTSTFSVDLIEVHIPMRSALVSEKKISTKFCSYNLYFFVNCHP